MELHTVQSNGKTYTFHAVKDTTLPCPECGVPACGRADILWYEEEGKRIAFIYDGSYFGLALQEFMEKNAGHIPYETLPQFIRESNEHTGWVDCDDYEGHEIGIDDFLKTMDLLRLCEMGKWITEQDIADMTGMALQAKEKGKKLKIVNG